MSPQGEFDFEEREAICEEQQENLDRVSTRVGWVIIRFCQGRYAREDRTFHADELHAEVLRVTGIAAPASADRILRDLRQRGVLDYVVLNRRASLYLVVRVPPVKEQ